MLPDSSHSLLQKQRQGTDTPESAAVNIVSRRRKRILLSNAKPTAYVGSFA
jgi:hypothetical protein